MRYVLIVLLLTFGCSPTESEIVKGCMDVDACNYNPDATDEDASCTYTLDNYDCDNNCIVNIDCLNECGGDAINDQCNICDGDGTSCLGCIDDIACNYDSDSTIDDGSCWFPDECECIDGEGAIPFDYISSWRIRIGASMLAWGVFQIEDTENYIGVSEEATNGYDEGIDFPEPPNSPGNYISLYFPHSEWGTMFGGILQENYTEDIKSTALCGTNKRWDIELYSNSTGMCTLIFDFFEGWDDMPCIDSSLSLYMVVDGTIYDVCDGSSHLVTLTENSVKNITILLTP